MNKILILLIVLLVSGCSDEKVKPPVVQGINTTEMPAQESFNSFITLTDSGKIKAEIEVGHIRVYYTKKETLLDSGLIVFFFDENQVRTSVLTANRGRIDDKTKDLHAYENVVVTDIDGQTLKSEELMWRNSDKKIVTNEFVTIKTETEDIEGYGFESDQSLKNYTIFRITLITTNTLIDDN